MLVGAGVGDDQRLPAAEHRVEQQLAVLAARVALAGQRVAGQHVVAVGDRAAREDAVVEARPGRPPGAAPTASAPAWQTVRWPVRKLARVGRGSVRCSSSVRTSASRSSVRRPATAASAQAVELPLELRHLPRSASGVEPPGRATPSRSAVSQAPASWRARSASTPSLEPVDDQLGQPPARSTCGAADVVERQHVPPRSRPSLSAIATPSRTRSSPARQVFWSKPVEAVRRPQLRGQPPPDARLLDPAGQRRRGRRRESRNRWRTGGAAGQVEHLARRGPAAGERDQRGGERQQRVGADQPAVGQPHPQLVAGVAPPGPAASPSPNAAENSGA